MGSKTEFYNKGQTVLDEGELSFEAYIIVDGEVDVFKTVYNRNLPAKEIHLATLKEGEIFGEIGWLDRKPRTATIKAKSRLELKVLTEDDAVKITRDNPKAMMPILKVLGSRLRDTLDLIEKFTGEPRL
jgi:CRP-like cAMP-binding protein